MQLVAKLDKDGNVLRRSKELSVTKIKIRHGNDFRLEVICDLPPSGDGEVKIMRTIYKEKPRLEFDKALDIILQFAIARSGLNPESWAIGKITEITLKYTEEGTNATIIASLPIDAETKAFIKLTETEISYELKSKIDNLVAETEDYISGLRAQLSLFEGEQP